MHVGSQTLRVDAADCARSGETRRGSRPAAGVLNVVMGKAEEIGGVFTADARVRKLTFTGSTAVGKRLTVRVRAR